MLKTIANVLASAIFETAHVIVTECNHRHVRPNSMIARHIIGEDFDCPFCDDDALDTGLTTRDLFRQWRAFDWNWQKGRIVHAIETANRIHREHNPEVLPLDAPFKCVIPWVERSPDVNSYIEQNQGSDLYRGPGGELALLIDAGLYAQVMERTRQHAQRRGVEMSEHWPNLPTPSMGAKIIDG